MKKKIQLILKKIKIKKTINFLKTNRMYIYMFLSLYILDISTRLASSSINFVKPMSLYPNLFSLIWLLLLIFTIKNIKSVYGKLIYGLSYGFSFIMFL